MAHNPDKTMRSMGPGAVAKRLGVSIKTLRVYESAGLLTPDRREGGWRTFGPAHIERLHSILALKAMGFSLKQVREIIAASPIDVSRSLDMQAAYFDGEIEQLQVRRQTVFNARRLLASGDRRQGAEA